MTPAFQAPHSNTQSKRNSSQTHNRTIQAVGTLACVPSVTKITRGLNCGVASTFRQRPIAGLLARSTLVFQHFNGISVVRFELTNSRTPGGDCTRPNSTLLVPQPPLNRTTRA